MAVLPYPEARTCVISSNAAAKRHGVGTGTGVDETRRCCPGLALVSQRPDLYVRVQRRVAHAVNAELPIDAVCSVDELCCVLGARDGTEDVERRIKARLREAVGPRVACSMGVASNRWLAKVASAMDKPDGLTVLDALPGRLLDLDLEDLPGVGARIRERLHRAGTDTVSALWAVQPKALRAVWGSVHGERLWYALHGHDVGPLRTRRGSVGHGRVLPPESRSAASARPWVRLLVVKAARRLRREGWTARRLGLGVERLGAPPWQGAVPLDRVNDDRACLAALGRLWAVLAADGEGRTVPCAGVARPPGPRTRRAGGAVRADRACAGEGRGAERGGRCLERAVRSHGGRVRALRGCGQPGSGVRGGEDCLRRERACGTGRHTGSERVRARGIACLWSLRARRVKYGLRYAAPWTSVPSWPGRYLGARVTRNAAANLPLRARERAVGRRASPDVAARGAGQAHGWQTHPRRGVMSESRKVTARWQ